MKEDKTDNAIEFRDQYKTKVYLYDYDEETHITIFYCTDIPNLNETVIVHRNGAFTKYKVIDRCLGVNSDTRNSVWNLYVSKIK